MKIPSLVIMDTINIDHENIKILNIPKSQKISLFVWFIRLCSPSIVHIGAFLMSAGPYKYILLKTWGLTYLRAVEPRRILAEPRGSSRTRCGLVVLFGGCCASAIAIMNQLPTTG